MALIYHDIRGLSSSFFSASQCHFAREKHILVVDRGQNRGIMIKTSKAATKTGFQKLPPRERPLVLRGSCAGWIAPPLPSRPPQRLFSAVCARRDKHRLSADEQCSSLRSLMRVSAWRTGVRRYGVQISMEGRGSPVTASKSGGLCPQAGWNRG